MTQDAPRPTLTPLRAAALLAAMSVGGLVLGQSLSPRGPAFPATGSLSAPGGTSSHQHQPTHTVATPPIVATHIPFRLPTASAPASGTGGGTVIFTIGTTRQNRAERDAGDGSGGGHAHGHADSGQGNHGHGHGHDG